MSPEGGDVTKVNFEIGVPGRMPRRMASALICTRLSCLPVSIANGKRPFSRVLTQPHADSQHEVRDAMSVLRKECRSPFVRDLPASGTARSNIA